MPRRKRRPHRAVEQAVPVGARDGAVAGMECGVYGLRPEHRDRFGQRGVHPAHPGAGGTLGIGVEMRYLLDGMDSAVGPASAGGGDGRAGNGTERRLDCVLHGAAVRLRLPAEETAAVVLQSYGDARRG